MKRFLRKKFYYTLFFSYLLLMLLCLIIGVLMFRSSLTQIENNAEQFNRITLSSVSSAFTQARLDIRSRMDELHTRDAYPSLEYAAEPITDAKLIQVADLQKELIRQVAYDTYISNIYIWFDHPQIAATTNGLFRTKASFDRMLTEKFGIGFDEILSLAENDGNVYIQALGSTGIADKLIAVITRNNGKFSSLEIVELRISAFLELLYAKDEESSAIFWAVSNATGQVIAPDEYSELILNVAPQVTTYESITNVKYNGSNLAVMCTDACSNFTIFSATDFSAYSQIYRNYIMVAIIYFIAYFAIGLLLSALLSKRNYRPIERLNNILMDKNADLGDDSEFALLEAGINSLLKSSRDYSRIQLKELKFQRERCIVSLLRGELNQNDFSKACNENLMQFSSNRFAVIGISIRDYSNLFLDGKSNEQEDALAITMFAVASVAGELLEECGSTYTCNYDGRVWAVVSPLPSNNITELDIANILRDCCNRSEIFLREQLGILTSYCFSKLTPENGGVEDISAAYRETLWGLKQIEGYSLENPVNSPDDVAAQMKPLTTQSTEDISTRRRYFFSAVTSGDFDEAHRLYLELRRQDLVFSGQSFSDVRTQTLVLVGYLLSNLPNNCRAAHSTEIDNYTHSIQREEHDEKLIVLMDEWMVYFNKIYNEIKIKGEKEDTALLAAHYINDHYAKTDISVARVAECLSVSPSYLSRIFREKYNISVLDYIHRRRMETAKLLLRESDITIADVAEQVGYTNALALIRAFKRSEGCTPTEYRKSLQD